MADFVPLAFLESTGEYTNDDFVQVSLAKIALLTSRPHPIHQNSFIHVETSAGIQNSAILKTFSACSTMKFRIISADPDEDFNAPFVYISVEY